MISVVVAGSRSIVLSATHILLVQVVAAQPGPWVETDPPLKQRNVDLTLRIERVFKRATDLTDGAEVRIAIVDYGRMTSRVFKVPGPWSERRLEPGERFVVFASGGGSPQEILRDPKMVLTDAEALADMELADEAEVEHLSMSALCERAQKVAARLGFLFPEYLLERHGETIFANAEEFEPVARLLTTPQLGNIARNSLLHLVNTAADGDRAAPLVEDRLIRALFHLVALPEAAPFAENVVKVYLKNRIGRRPAWLTFRDAPAERERAKQVLAGRSEPEAAAIQDWLAPVIVDVLPDSRSLLLRATHVVRIVLTAAQPAAWEPSGEAVSRRKVQLRVRVEEIFKGVQSKLDGERAVGIEQYRSDGKTGTPVPGAWSGMPVEAGQGFVVLGVAPGLQAALEAPQRVLPSTVAGEVRLVAAAERDRLPAPTAVEWSKPIAKELSSLFADWLWARHGEEALQKWSAADAVFSLLELPALAEAARNTLADLAVSRAAAELFRDAVGVRRLAKALFRLLGMREAAGLREKAVSTWLPALLRLRSERPLSPAQVFDDAERAEAKRALAAYKGSADPAPLAAWLEGR